MNTRSNELQLLYIQFYSSIMFSIAIIVSIILNYNNILKHSDDRCLFEKSTEVKITMCNRVFLTFITLVFTYIYYSFYRIDKQKNKGTISFYEFVASILTLLSAFILLFTTFKNIEYDQNDTTDSFII